MSNRVLADDVAKVVNVITDGPKSVRDIADATGLPGWLVDETLCQMRLAGQVGMEPVRIKGKGKVNHFSLKLGKGS